jgi:ABC-type transport system substrate-binding protein
MTVYLDYSFARKQGGYGWDNASLEDDEVEAVLDNIDKEMDDKKRAELSHQFELLLAKKYSPLVPMLSYNIHYSWYAYMKGIDEEISKSGQGGWQINRWIDKA